MLRAAYGMGTGGNRAPRFYPSTTDGADDDPAPVLAPVAFSERTIVAHHEAGHCVAALALRQPIHSLELLPDGMGVFRNSPDASDNEQKLDEICGRFRAAGGAPTEALAPNMVGYFAGMAAEMYLTKRPARYGGRDIRVMKALLDTTDLSSDERRTLAIEAQKRAGRCVEYFWPIVQKLATHLDMRRYLGAGDILATVRLCSPVLVSELLGEGLRYRPMLLQAVRVNGY
jgi:hypothetical protein